MNASDFMQAQSTQQLLYSLFCSEVGLFSVSSSAVQMAGVIDSFHPLQENIVRNLREGVEQFELSVGGGLEESIAMSYRTDAFMFKKLYASINQHEGDTDSQMLNSCVYSLVSGMILGNSMLKKRTIALLQAHVEKYGSAVGARICKTLGAFNLSLLGAELASSIKVSENAALA